MRAVLASSSTLKHAFIRKYSQSSSCPLHKLVPHFDNLQKSLSPTVVALDTFFSGAADNPQSHRRGTGVFINPTLILTSAQAVGRISTSYESKPLQKPNRFEHGRVLHKSDIGNTVATTSDSQLLKTNPLVVNFAHDLALLKLVKHEETLIPHCAVANSNTRLGKEDVLLSISHRQNLGFVGAWGTVTPIGGKFETAKTDARAPWPLDDGLRWVEHVSLRFPEDPPLVGSSNFGGRVTGVVTWATGSPLFNRDGEVVGVSSWESSIVYDDECDRFSVGFAVPLLCIKAVFDYAEMKGQDDPIVMDRWIDSTQE